LFAASALIIAADIDIISPYTFKMLAAAAALRPCYASRYTFTLLIYVTRLPLILLLPFVFHVILPLRHYTLCHTLMSRCFAYDIISLPMRALCPLLC